MKVLSLFDGMSCGQLALNRLGIKVDTYYASEIDKYAMQVTQANFPKTIQVGDVCNLDPNDFKDVDLMLAGSPCQGFSFAGKQLAFDDPRSALFFEFIRLLKEIKPKYFLLENVKMKKEYLQVISEQVSACYPEIPFGIEPIFINSSLVSAQSRQRYYWTNIPNITQPKERGIVLRDILEDQVGSEHYVGNNLQENYQGGNQLNPNYKSQANTIHDANKKSGTICAGTHGYANGYVGDKHKPTKDTERNRKHRKNLDEKSLCMTASMYKGAGNNGMTLVPQHIGTAVDINGHDILKRVYSPDGKSPTVNTCQGGNREPKVVSGAWRARSLDDAGKNVKWKETKPKKMLELRKDDKSNSITTSSKDSVVTVQSYNRNDGLGKELDKAFALNASDWRGLNRNQNQNAVVSHDDGQMYWRKLTPLECERLQTVPDNYTNHVSNTQRYKMLGNGWTIEVITHILKNMEL